MFQMDCAKCKAYLGDMNDRAAFIYVEVMGNEYIYACWFCKAQQHFM